MEGLLEKKSKSTMTDNFPLSTSLLTSFKLRVSMIGAVNKWEARIVSAIRAFKSLDGWSQEIYRLRVFLDGHRCHMVSTFDPENRFFQFMEDWKAQIVYQYTPRLLDYRDSSSFATVAKRKDRSGVKQKLDTSEEGLAASRVLSFLGIDARVHEDDFAVADSDESGDESAIILASLSSVSSGNNSLSNTPEAKGKRSISPPQSESPVSSKHHAHRVVGDEYDLSVSSLAEQLYANLNLDKGCLNNLHLFEANLRFRVHNNNLALENVLAATREFCRANVGSGFYDEKGRLVHIVSTWYQHSASNTLADTSME